MVRSIPAPTLEKLGTNLGTEPVMVVEIDWSRQGTWTPYSDKQAPGVFGKILRAPPFDEIVNVSKANVSQELSGVVLDDTDGSIKRILDRTDVHKAPVRVYQWFTGVDLEAKFRIFTGLLNTPIEWGEGERTVTISILSRIEDASIGFSAEEGDFPGLPEELIGRPWPLCFGTTMHVPALRVMPAVSGTLSRGVGIKDFTLQNRLNLARQLVCSARMTGANCSGSTTGSHQCKAAYEWDLDCMRNRCMEIERLTVQLEEQTRYEYRQFHVYGGHKFPQNTRITIDINGGRFTGRFNGTLFTVESRLHPDNDGTGRLKRTDKQRALITGCNDRAAVVGYTAVNPPTPAPGMPAGPEIGPPSQEVQAVCQNEQTNVHVIWGPLTLQACESATSWERYRRAEQSRFFWAQGGTVVTLATNQPIIYITNLLPSTIHRVAAWRTINGNRFLVTVPPKYYTMRLVNYQSYVCTEIVMQQPLSSRDQDHGGGWTDDLYISQTSSVGPNTVDIVRWLIETYTEHGIDEESFDEVRAKIDVYRMDFPILERKNIIAALQEIAFQARCAIWMKDDKFFIRYLAEEPTPVATITESDVLHGTLKIALTKTEDLYTDITTNWRRDYAYDDKKLILRHNVKQYGTRKLTQRFYCFSNLDIVRKAATFWLIRTSNTWRKVAFSTPLSKLNVEVFDAVELHLPDVSPNPVVGVVESAIYDSTERVIKFEVWTPTLSGTQDPYPFALPANIEERLLWPTKQDRQRGYAGSGDGGHNFMTIAPIGHPLRINRQNVAGPSTGAGQNAGSFPCNGGGGLYMQITGGQSASGLDECRPDFGDNFPSDIGDQYDPPQIIQGGVGSIDTESSPETAYIGTADMFTNSWNNHQTALGALQTGGLANQNAQAAQDKQKMDSEETESPSPDAPVEEPEEGDPCNQLVAVRKRVSSGISTISGELTSTPGSFVECDSITEQILSRYEVFTNWEPFIDDMVEAINAQAAIDKANCVVGNQWVEVESVNKTGFNNANPSLQGITQLRLTPGSEPIAWDIPVSIPLQLNQNCFPT